MHNIILFGFRNTHISRLVCIVLSVNVFRYANEKNPILFHEFFSPIYGDKIQFYRKIKKNLFPFNVIYTDYTVLVVYVYRTKIRTSKYLDVMISKLKTGGKSYHQVPFNRHVI